MRHRAKFWADRSSCCRGMAEFLFSGCIPLSPLLPCDNCVILTGALPNTTQNATKNAAELVSYDLIKETLVLRLRLMNDNWSCRMLSAFGAGFCATCVASLVDVVKTRYISSSLRVYTGALYCTASMLRERDHRFKNS